MKEGGWQCRLGGRHTCHRRGSHLRSRYCWGCRGHLFLDMRMKYVIRARCDLLNNLGRRSTPQWHAWQPLSFSSVLPRRRKPNTAIAQHNLLLHLLQALMCHRGLLVRRRWRRRHLRGERLLVAHDFSWATWGNGVQ